MASRGVNRVTLVGNLGADPVVRSMPNQGGVVANVSIATSETWRDKNTGQQQEKTEWHRVVFFNRLAEIVRDYLRKGSKVYVEGKLQTRKWTDQSGAEKYTTEIVANEMQMLDSRGAGGGNAPAGGDSYNAPQSPQSEPTQVAPSAPPAAAGPDTFDDDDIPF